jgi:hypothetical protein
MIISLRKLTRKFRAAQLEALNLELLWSPDTLIKPYLKLRKYNWV